MEVLLTHEARIISERSKDGSWSVVFTSDMATLAANARLAKKKRKKTSLESELVTDSSRPPLNRIERTFIRIISPRMLKKKHFTFLFSIAFTLSRLSRGTIVESMIGPFLSLSLSLFPFFFFRLLIRAYIENVSRNVS